MKIKNVNCFIIQDFMRSVKIKCLENNRIYGMIKGLYRVHIGLSVGLRVCIGLSVCIRLKVFNKDVYRIKAVNKGRYIGGYA